MSKTANLKHVISLLLLFAITPLHAQHKKLDTTNYFDYYKTVNRAEKLFFMKGKTDRALKLYDKAFKAYDFVFVTDLIEAAQIAHFKQRPFKKYLKRGFQFGLKFEHLKNYPIFKPDLEKIKADKALRIAFKKGREKYLAKIDFHYLSWLYKLYLKDQIDKRQRNYHSVIKRTQKQIKHKIIEKGFPGEWIIGVPDSTIFAEHGIHQLDIREQKKKFGDQLWYVHTKDKALSPTNILVLLIHTPCPYGELKKLLWEEMKKGHLYPRSIGMLYDKGNSFTKNYDVTHLCHQKKSKNNAYFRLNAFTRYPEITEENLKKTDSLRKAFYIVPYEVDLKKKEFQKKYGFRLFPRYFEPLQKSEPYSNLVEKYYKKD